MNHIKFLKEFFLGAVPPVFWTLALLRPVQAQVDFGHVYSHMPSTLGLLSTPIMGQDFGRSSPTVKARVRLEPEVYRFKPSLKVTEAIEKDIVEAIVRQLPNTSIGELSQQFKRERLKPQFDAIMLKYGYSPHNLADVMVAYAVLSWEAYSQERVTQGQIQGATVMLRNAVARTPRLATLTDVEKQRTAEKLTYAAMFGVGVMRNSPNPQASRESVRNHVRHTLGIDFARVRLSNQGFISSDL
ncbi:MAG: hypothetical protein MH252_16980 [Thermosynechococcaceae cyanobacterium MS004]|nr:hypothetical protein [Thermosynechococcaceae cyanobacterium MS004]